MAPPRASGKRGGAATAASGTLGGQPPPAAPRRPAVADSPNDSPGRGRGRRILAAGARTLGRSLARPFTRTEAGAHWARVGGDWFATLSELKGAAMKMGQMMSQYADLLPPELAEQLSRLQASAEPLPWSDIEELLRERWSEAQWAKLAHIDPTPLASASIGQVHLAALVDGRAVAVKVRYPGVAEAVDADVRNLGRLMRVAGVLPLDRTDLDAMLAEVRARLREEVDYELERERLALFNDLPHSDGVVYPKPIDALCADGVLVCSYEPGSAVEEARGWPQPLRDALAARYCDWVIASLLDHGWLHADPHPGNFAFREDGRLVVYDFGCVKQVAGPEQTEMVAIVRAALARDWPAVHATMGRMGSLSRPDAPLTPELEQVYREHVDALAGPLLADPPFDFSDADFIPEARRAIRGALPQWRAFKLVPELAFVVRTLSGAYWLLRRLGARVDLASRLEAIAARHPHRPAAPRRAPPAEAARR